MISEIIYDLGNYLGNFISSRKLSQKFYIILEILYHLGNCLGNFKWSRKFFMISEITSEIIYDLGNDLGNFISFYIIFLEVPSRLS